MPFLHIKKNEVQEHKTLSNFEQTLLSDYFEYFPRTCMYASHFNVCDINIHVTLQMQPFEEKLGKELKASGRVVACRFPLPSWEPIATFGEGVDMVWLYRVPSSTN
jgi:hypothetical protein